MKTKLIATLILVTPAAFAQTPAFDDLRIQGAAALAISENAPTEIALPTGARQLGLSILGASSGTDFAFETKPYWWSKHAIGESYYQNTTYGWDAIQQSFSISGARYEFENRAGDDVAGISFGVAFDLVRGPASREFNEALDGYFTKFPAKIDVNNPLAGAENLVTDENREAVSDAVASLVKGRVGWNASFATAATYEFDDTDYNGGEFSKFGAWLVGSYTPDTDGDKISFIGLARVINDQGPARDDTYIDSGLRLMWSLDNIPLTLSVEYIRRFADKTDDSDRFSALLEYQVNETMSVFVSHGANFDQTAKSDEVFTAAGLSFGIGN